MLFSALFPVSLLHLSGHWHCFMPIPKLTQKPVFVTTNITAKSVLRDATQRTTISAGSGAVRLSQRNLTSYKISIYSGIRACYSSLEQNTPISFSCCDLGILQGGGERRRTQNLTAQGTRIRISCAGNVIYH